MEFFVDDSIIFLCLIWKKYPISENMKCIQKISRQKLYWTRQKLSIDETNILLKIAFSMLIQVSFHRSKQLWKLKFHVKFAIIHHVMISTSSNLTLKMNLYFTAIYCYIYCNILQYLCNPRSYAYGWLSTCTVPCSTRNCGAKVMSIALIAI